MKLYEIAPEFAELVEKEELTEEDFERLESLGHALEVKADNIVSLSENMMSFVDMCKAEEKRIADRRKAVENRIAWVKGYLQRNMESAGIFEIEIGTRKIALQKNPPKVVVDDEEKIPARFFTVIPEQYQLDKTGLKNALKSGEIDGAHLEQGLRLVIK